MSLYAQKHNNCPTCRCTEPVSYETDISKMVNPSIPINDLMKLVEEWQAVAAKHRASADYFSSCALDADGKEADRLWNRFDQRTLMAEFKEHDAGQLEALING